MSKNVDFYYDFVSSASYVAYKRLPKMLHDAGGHISWKPMLLGGVFKAVGNSGPAGIAAKGKWMFDDLTRICARHGLPFSVNAKFPLNTVTALRGAIAAGRIDDDVRDIYMGIMFDGAWANDDDISDPDVIMELMDNAGLPAQEIANMAQDQAVKDALRASTEEAVERGVFGAPTFFVKDEMHWGQDRIDDVIEALNKKG